MSSSGSAFLSMIRDSISEPAATAQRLLRLGPGLSTILQGLALVSILGSLMVSLAGGGALTIPLPEGDLTVSPIAYAVVLAGSLLLTAGSIQVAGQLLGGRGTFRQALLVVVWLEVVAVTVQVVQLAVAVLLPPLAPILGLIGLALLAWCLVNFVRTLHGFKGFGRTILTLILAALAAGVALAMLIGFLGFGGSPNV